MKTSRGVTGFVSCLIWLSNILPNKFYFYIKYGTYETENYLLLANLLLACHMVAQNYQLILK